MSQISAKIIEDSISPEDARLTTMELCYPRFIHGELMTHRVFSRNAMSSRAIPVKKMIEQVRSHPVMPHHWGQNQPGMQAREQISMPKREEAMHEWSRAAQHAAYFAERLDGLGVHKQIVNRLLEPFQWMKTIVTATDWDNFFGLRLHEDAEPHFQILAKAMKKVMDESISEPRGSDYTLAANWHLPYVSVIERSLNAGHPGLLARLSAARCARVSFLNHDGSAPDPVKDMDLFEKLNSAVPKHASPLEHQAVPFESPGNRSANFTGWIQFRQIL